MRVVRPATPHRKVVVMLEAHLDESGIHDKAKICVVGGFYGGPSQMRRLEKAWKATLKSFRFEMKDFHAKDLIKRRDHHKMLFALADVIGEQKKVHPVSFGVMVDDFWGFTKKERQFLTGAMLMFESGKLIGGSPQRPYFVPFSRVVKAVTDAAPVGGKAHFFFGVDRSVSGYARTLFAQFERNRTRVKPGVASHWKSRDRLGTPAFPPASETAQLQAADLFIHARYLQYVSPDPSLPEEHVARILSGCLVNQLTRANHAYQDKKSLTKMLDEVKASVPAWKWED